MIERAGGPEAALVQQVASDYRAKGYDVSVHPPDDQLPPALAQYRPDIVARKGEESVVIEVKSRHALRQAPHVQELAAAVKQLRGWRFELIVAKPDVAFPLPVRTEPWDIDEIRGALDEARSLSEAGHVGPALLMAWAATEAALRMLAEREGVLLERSDGNALLGRLTAHGILARPQYKVLRGALEVRNALAHGLRAVEAEPAQVHHLIEIVEELLALRPAA